MGAIRAIEVIIRLKRIIVRANESSNPYKAIYGLLNSSKLSNYFNGKKNVKNANF